MKKFMASTIAAISLLFMGNALAHANNAKRGGVVQSAGNYTFELVRQHGSVIIYVEDHGNVLETVGATGSLTIFKGAQKKVLPLEAGIGNTLVAPGARLADGSKAVASITFPNKSVIGVRFSID